MEKVKNINNRILTDRYKTQNYLSDLIINILVDGFGDDVTSEFGFFYREDDTLSFYINKRIAFYIAKEFDVSLWLNDRFIDNSKIEIPHGDKRIGMEDFFRIKGINVDIINSIAPLLIEICEAFLMLGSLLTFDCCDLFEKCSNEMKCIRLDQKRAHFCTYRRKLKEGIIYIGKNRNID